MKKVFGLFIALTLAFSLAACSNGPEPAPEASQPAVQSSQPVQQLQGLSIGILPDVDSIPLIIAKHNGYFEKHGLKVNIESFKSAVDRDSALQAGKIDGAVSDMLAAAFATEGNFDVAITSLTNGSYKLLVGKDSKINSFEDIKGKGIAISKNTIIEFATDVMLNENNIKSEEINKVVIPQIPVRLEMLSNGKVDGATLPEPLASVAIKGGAKMLNSTDKLGINPGVLLFTKKSVDSKPDEIKAFYKAYNDAVDYLQKEKVSDYIDILIKEAGFPQDVKDTITLPSYTKAASPSEKDFNKVIEWLKAKELIKNSYKYSDLVNDSFVR